MSKNALSSRIKQIRTEANKTQAQFSKDIGITQGNLSLIESGKTVLNLETLQKIRKKFNLSYSWIIDGKASYSDSKNLIPLVDQSAMAGYPANHTNDEFINNLARYRIPGFENGEYKIFEVEGESMLPTLLPHDFIICVKIENLEKVVDGSLTVIVLEDAVLVKRIYKVKKNEFRFESDNINYKSIEVKSSEVVELFGVQAKITQSLHSASSPSDKKLGELESKIDLLSQEMEKIKNNQK